MSVFFHLLRLDVMLQIRSGFWIAAVFIMLPWLGVLWPLTQERANFVTPAMIFLDISLTGTMLMAGSYFFQRREGSLYALVISPMKTWHWIGSKVVSLTAICMVMCVILVALKSGLSASWGPILLACLCINVQFALLGFLLAVPFEKFTSFLVANSLVFGLLEVPALAFFNIETPLYWLWPSHPSLLLLRGAFQGAPVLHMLGYLAAQLAWTALFAWLSLRWFHRYISARQGG